MREYARFLVRCLHLSFTGDGRYHLWMFLLSVATLLGINAFARQFVLGMATTGLTDHVSWGLYISNFTFLVGMTAASVMLVIPVYFFRQRGLANLVIFIELLAVACVVMTMLFVLVDTGRPDRFLHLLTGLTWDVVALGVYLLLNLHVWGYLIYRAYQQRRPGWGLYVPFVLLALFWSVIIHTVTKYLYVGMGDRQFWDSALFAPRFVAAAFTVGAAFLAATLLVIRKVTSVKVADPAVRLLALTARSALALDLGLLAASLWFEFGGSNAPRVSVEYLYLGLGGRGALVPWVWTAIGIEVGALGLLCLPAGRRPRLLFLACVLAVLGVWVEKDIGLIIPAFVPTQLGELVEYAPTANEILVCLGILACGLLVFTILVRITIPVLAGQLTRDRETHRDDSASPWQGLSPRRETGGPS